MATGANTIVLRRLEARLTLRFHAQGCNLGLDHKPKGSNLCPTLSAPSCAEAWPCVDTPQWRKTHDRSPVLLVEIDYRWASTVPLNQDFVLLHTAHRGALVRTRNLKSFRAVLGFVSARPRNRE